MHAHISRQPPCIVVILLATEKRKKWIISSNHSSRAWLPLWQQWSRSTRDQEKSVVKDYRAIYGPQYTKMANVEDLHWIQHRRILLIYQSFCSLSMPHCLLMHLLLSAALHRDHKRGITQAHVKDYNRFLKTTTIHKYLGVHKYFSCDDISA